MPKRSSKPKLDTVQNARRVVMESVGEVEPQEMTEEPAETPTSPTLISKVMAEMGRRGGRIGGKRRLDTLSSKRRTEIARQAAKARWAKRKKSRVA